MLVEVANSFRGVRQRVAHRSFNGLSSSFHGGLIEVQRCCLWHRSMIQLIGESQQRRVALSSHGGHNIGDRIREPHIRFSGTDQ